MRLSILSAACAICLALPATAQEGNAKNPAPKEASAAKKLQGMAFPGAHAMSSLAVFASDFAVSRWSRASPSSAASRR